MTAEQNYSKDKTAEQLVKDVYPNAKNQRDGVLFFVTSEHLELGAGFTYEAAWRSALSKLIDKGLLTNL